MSQKIEVSSTMTDAGIPARPSSEPEAEKVIPISFACPWPSLWRRFLSYLWPTVDVALIAALVLTYFPHPLIPSNPSSQEAAQVRSIRLKPALGRGAVNGLYRITLFCSFGCPLLGGYAGDHCIGSCLWS
eukprot:755167-Hanusia_phi.AAC.9